MSIVLPEGYKYPIASVTATFWLLFWQTYKVGEARKAAKIQYPQLYAEKDEMTMSREARMFNCTQRAHQNTLEVLPFVTFGTLISGLKYPGYASALCGLWILGRAVYTINYSRGDAENRNKGFFPIWGTLGAMGLVLLSSITAVQFLLQ